MNIKTMIALALALVAFAAGHAQTANQGKASEAFAVEIVLVAPDVLEKYVGVYSQADSKFQLAVTRDGTTLSVHSGGSPHTPLEAIAYNQFKTKKSGVVYTFDVEKKQLAIKTKVGDQIYLKEDLGPAMAVALPLVNDFATRVGLPIPLPVTKEHVAELRPFSRLEDEEGLVVLRGGHKFWYMHGIIQQFTAPGSPTQFGGYDISPLFGQTNISVDTALALARTNLVKLGYDLEALYADLEPQITMPARLGTNLLPFYKFEWRPPNRSSGAIRTEIDGKNGHLLNLSLISSAIWKKRPPPGTNAPPPPKKYSLENIVPVSLAQFLQTATEVCRQVPIPITLPLNLGSIKAVEYIPDHNFLTVTLTNGWDFFTLSPEVMRCYAPDTFFRFDKEPKSTRPFFGGVHFTDEDATRISREVLAKLTRMNDAYFQSKAPTIHHPDLRGTNSIPRRLLIWSETYLGRGYSRFTVEVDVGQLQIKSVEIGAKTPIFDYGTIRLK